MLFNLKDLQGDAIRATDGDIGTVKDCYFDDERWTVRYLVVETGSWLDSRKVLISPISLGLPSRADKVIPASITTEQVRLSPAIDTDRPVSRQHESDYLAYYGYPAYWGGAGLWGGDAVPGMMGGLGFVAVPPPLDAETQQALADADARRHEHDDPHLRSCRYVEGYHLQAVDGEIGKVQGYLLDPQSWEIRYLVVETGTWAAGHPVLVSPGSITSVNWEDRTVAVDLTQQAVRDAPTYDPNALPSPEASARILRHYPLPYRH